MPKVGRLALFMVLALGVSTVQAAEAVKRTAARPDLGRVGGLGHQLSRSLQPLAADPGVQKTVRVYQTRIRKIDKTIARAQKLLAQKSLDPDALAKIEAELRTHQVELRKIQTRLDMNRDELNAEIAIVEADRETVRNERQMASTQFENANKIAGQYMNMIASVMKTIKEMRRGVIRNLR
jgi:hypothetical protein